MELREILEDYKKMVEIYREPGLNPSREVVEGGVYRLSEDNPLFVVVVNDNRSFVDVIPLSFCWPLATKNDFLIEFPHLLSDIWMVEVDLTTSTPVEVVKKGEFQGKLKEEDLKILKSVLKGERELPKDRTGSGGKDPIHNEFKEFEYKRYKFLVKQLLKWQSQEESNTLKEVWITRSERELLEENSYLKLVAASERKVIETEKAIMTYDEEREEVLIVLKDNTLIGKNGAIKLHTPEGEIILFEGKLPEAIKVRGISREGFPAFQNLELEVK
ncbi:hypothetical protein [Thermovibrio sp.]